MEDQKEMVFFYIARLFEEIKNGCFERNQQASRGGSTITAPIVGPKCPYHLLCNIEKNREKIVQEIQLAELYLVNFLKAPLPRKPLEVAKWLTKK